MDNFGDNMQMGRHKNLLFAHSRSASVHCSEAPAIPNVLLGMTQLKPLRVKFLCLIKGCAKVLKWGFAPHDLYSKPLLRPLHDG
jgi:hypothetical protein